jgi:hypothetical protein
VPNLSLSAHFSSYSTISNVQKWFQAEERPVLQVILHYWDSERNISSIDHLDNEYEESKMCYDCITKHALLS